jgi:hypothetical protein
MYMLYFFMNVFFFIRFCHLWSTTEAMDIFSLMLVNLPNRRQYKTQDEGCLHIYMTMSLKEGYFL